MLIATGASLLFLALVFIPMEKVFPAKEGQKILDEYHLPLYLSDSKYAFHINEKGVDKAYGLKEALAVLKVEPNQVVAIGDSETDIPMYGICGCSIALDHADDTVKAQADHVVAGREGAGLVEAIDFVAFNYLGVKA